MTRFLTIKQLKGVAREQLLGKYSIVIFSQLFYYSAQFSIALINSLSPEDTIISQILSLLILFASNVFWGIFQFGLATFYLNVASNQPFHVLHLFEGFRKNPERTLKISLIITIISTLCNAPCTVLSILIKYNVINLGKFYIPILLAAMALCGIIEFLIFLRFNFVYYLLVDLPDISFGKIIKMSFWLMKGNCFRFLLLQLSFIPLLLLGYMTFGIGLLWVYPYVNTTNAYFYLDVSSKKA